MIACIGKNSRCLPLFKALSEFDQRFQFVGLASADRQSKMLGAALSCSPSKERTRQLLEFSPPVISSIEKSCVSLLDALPETPEAVLFWGATNMPVSGNYKGVPYYVITDGPFDPNDPIYPDIWQPGRWRHSYFEMQNRLYKGAKHIFTLSEWSRSKVQNVHAVESAGVTKIGWGALHTIETRVTGNSNGRSLILSVGNHWYLKGMDIVAKAGGLLAAAGANVETVIAGEPHGMSLGPCDGVTFVPNSLPVSVVHRLLIQASVLVVASRFDASPHIIPEAYQYGVPVIGTDVCGIPEAVPPSRIVKRECSAQELADCISRTLKSQSESVPEAYPWSQAAQIIISKVASSAGKGI